MSPRTVIRTVFISVLGLLALALPGAANAAAHRAGAVVFSQSWVTTTEENKEKKEVEEGGLFAVRDGRSNQLTENAADPSTPSSEKISPPVSLPPISDTRKRWRPKTK